MSKNRIFHLLSGLAILALLVAACGTPTTAAPVATEAPPAVDTAATEAAMRAAETQTAADNAAAQAAADAAATQAVVDATAAAIAEIGTESHPIKVLFVPSVEANIITTGGEVMGAALEQATGLKFEVIVPTSYAATIEEMCASPNDTMAFIPGLGYALASQRCGVDVAFKAIRFGFPAYWAQFLVPRDSDIDSLEDLDGLKWGYGDVGSTSGYMVPLVMFNEAGITPSEEVQTGGHNQSVTALYNGEVDFATTFYSVPLNPDGAPAWSWDDYLGGGITEDMYEVPAETIENCAPNAEGTRLFCDGWRILDARANIRTEAPDVVQKIRILAVSPAIPNDTLSFGPDFPAELRSQIEAALIEFSTTEAWETSIGSQDFYGWTGIDTATDAEYDFIRKMVELAGLSLEDL